MTPLEERISHLSTTIEIVTFKTCEVEVVQRWRGKNSPSFHVRNTSNNYRWDGPSSFDTLLDAQRALATYLAAIIETERNKDLS
ncbi:hypothetical protein [Curtobacterium sp. MCBA15_004]|uniref:hypothetical protein n=1 Tax=Curtobacterium sp. MCBA15_004 TaxID=1898733 RepID=UPI0008DE7FDB|nr:hypothetical protein [Curtobacterium sp. MCBA15_004]WIA95771.1 hypothetical protein QOL16_11695 [Curtobacterium sp. MCBA15_004]